MHLLLSLLHASRHAALASTVLGCLLAGPCWNHATPDRSAADQGGLLACSLLGMTDARPHLACRHHRCLSPTHHLHHHSSHRHHLQTSPANDTTVPAHHDSRRLSKSSWGSAQLHNRSLGVLSLGCRYCTVMAPGTTQSHSRLAYVNLQRSDCSSMQHTCIVHGWPRPSSADIDKGAHAANPDAHWSTKWHPAPPASKQARHHEEQHRVDANVIKQLRHVSKEVLQSRHEHTAARSLEETPCMPAQPVTGTMQHSCSKMHAHC